MRDRLVLVLDFDTWMEGEPDSGAVLDAVCEHVQSIGLRVGDHGVALTVAFAEVIDGDVVEVDVQGGRL